MRGREALLWGSVLVLGVALTVLIAVTALAVRSGSGPSDPLLPTGCFIVINDPAAGVQLQAPCVLPTPAPIVTPIAREEMP